MNLARFSNGGRSSPSSIELDKFAMVEETMLNPLRRHFKAVLVITRTSLQAGFTVPLILADQSYVDQVRLRSVITDLNGYQ